MQGEYIVSIDFGTSRIALSVARKTGDCFEVCFFDEKPCTGIVRGAIVNTGKVRDTLKELVDQVYSELQIKITQASVALPRYGIRQTSVTQKMDRSDPDAGINVEELEFLSDAAEQQVAEVGSDEKVFAVIPQHFSTEDVIQYTEEEVVGCTGRYLEGTFKVIIGPARAESHIYTVLGQLGITASSVFFLPAFEGNIFLTKNEIEQGTALVELGAGVTSVSIYHRGILKYYASIPFGGLSVSTDIRNECHIELRLADNIKKAYGNCMHDRRDLMDDKVLHVCNNDTGTDTHVQVKQLSKIISAREKEIVDAILFHIQKSGFSELLSGGIVLCGGGARMEGIGLLFSDLSGYNVRTAVPVFPKVLTSGWAIDHNVEYCTSVALLGLSKAFGQVEEENLKEAEKEGPEQPADGKLFKDSELVAEMPHKDKVKGKNMLRKIGDKVKENFEIVGDIFDMSGKPENGSQQ